jgi:aquaporin Z
MLGTFALTLVAAGGEVVAEVSGGAVSPAARAVAPGLLVLAFIYTLGDVSGAHFNPAVTFAFALRRVFPWRWVAGYWTSQLVGAALAAGLLAATFGPVADLGATHARQGTEPALVMEVVLSCLLLMVILGTARRHELIGPNAAVAVGSTIALCGLFAGPVSGASMNPARSLGPALPSGALDEVWIYVIGPFAGAALAVGFTTFLRPHHHPDEDEAATGKCDD